jgi:CheY-like chemotaxis protein
MVCGGSIEIMPDQTFVLVAEDEELVRLVIVQALLDDGFEVLCAGRRIRHRRLVQFAT